jgi:DivIVA domain-containing protein
MSIFDMDVTGPPDADSIQTREFATVRKGYDRDEVRAYLGQLSRWIEDLQDQLADAGPAEAELRAPAAVEPGRDAGGSDADPYEALGSHVADLLRTAEDHAKRVREEADDTAERILEEARLESDRLRRLAQEESESVRQTAEAQADATRIAAQEEADRAREEAARALENARIEAESTIAALSERRNALAAELNATRSRLLEILSQLGEDQQEPVRDEQGPVQMEFEPGSDQILHRARPELVPPLPDIQAFRPPPPPQGTPIARDETTEDTIEPIEFLASPPIEAPDDGSSGDEVVDREADTGVPGPQTTEFDGVEDTATPQAPAEPIQLPSAERNKASEAQNEDDPPADRSFLQWTREETEPDGADMPSPEDEDRLGL